jgi:hypothetical protein
MLEGQGVVQHLDVVRKGCLDRPQLLAGWSVGDSKGALLANRIKEDLV